MHRDSKILAPPADSPIAHSHIAVIGAGIVGLSCALWLQKKGFSVTLIDPAQPGSGASSGNACTIADYGCIPVNNPALFKRLPHLLFSKQSPLSIDPWYAATHLPWCLKFLAHCRAAKVDHIKHTLAELLAKTYEGLNPLLEASNASHLLRDNGCMYVYKTAGEYAAAQAANQFRRKLGFSYQEITSAQIAELEPGLKMRFHRGILFDQTSQVVNPLTLCSKYFDCFLENGGQIQNQAVQSLKTHSSNVELSFADGSTLAADKAVVAAGAFSKSIKGSGAEQLPLDTERGYHVQYAGLQTKLNRPVSWNEQGFYVTPMDEGLRIVGTVEIAGYKPKLNPHHTNYLIEKGQQMFDLPAKPSGQWLGFRPTLPDSLPAIGLSPQSDRVIFAFGHHHLGLTLAGITGKIIAELLADEPLCHDIEAFSPSRF